MRTLHKVEETQFRIEILETPKIRKFIEAHAAALDTSFQKVEMSEGMRRRLERSNYIFSGMKTFHELNEAFPSLLDENGNRKPFKQFLNDVQKIDKTYNAGYLRAEYNFVQASAQMAAKWEGFMRDGDRYNLQYRTAGDKKVRPGHAALDRVTLPITDTFWESYYPPNGWNCFIAGTPILTAKGWQGIECIKEGDLVYGGSGHLCKVAAVMTRPTEEQIVTILTYRNSATCTENHRFCTHRGWVRAVDLKTGDIIIQLGKVSFPYVCVNAIHNMTALIRKARMAFQGKWKAVTSLTIDDQVKVADIKVSNKTAKKNATVKMQTKLGKMITKRSFACRKRGTQSTHTLRMQDSPNSTLSNTPMIAQPTKTPQLCKIAKFAGIKDIAAFNGFNSFYYFIRDTFFHNSYSVVLDKVTKNKGKTTVYNLEVEEDESYITKIGIAHNCRCTVVQVLKSKYPVTPHDEAMALGEEATGKDTKGIFHFNAGLEQKSVPDYNPYTISRCRDCDIAKGKLKLAFIPDNELCDACRLIRAQKHENTGAAKRILKYDEKKWERTYVSPKDIGLVATQLERIAEATASNAERNKFDKEMRMCKVLADNGHDVEYLQGVNRPAGQTYDILFDNIKADLKCVTGGAGNIVKYAKKALTKQGGEAVVFEIPSHNPKYYEALAEARRKCTGRIFFYFMDDMELKEIK